MTKVIKCTIFIVAIFFVHLSKHTLNGYGYSSNTDEGNVQNAVNASVNDKTSVNANEHNDNLVKRYITPSITVGQVILIVFSSIASSMFIMIGIFCALFYMHKRRVISRKVLTGEETALPMPVRTRTKE
uniref:Glycophorin n=1 Tax=Strongyloides stercoralis TaxID=6248 RepID=A0A0K0ET55_STRER